MNSKPFSMKVAGVPHDANKIGRHAAVIPLHKTPRATKDKSAATEYKCYKDPTNTKSAAHSVTICHFDNESPEELLEFLEQVKAVEKGQGLTTGPDKYTLMRQVLKGVALTAFENAAATAGSETIATYRNCVQAVKVAIFPPKAATRQRRAIAKMRKPIDWTMRQYVARLHELNNQVPKYPTKDDGTAYAKHPEDELVSFAEGGLPNKYCNFLREHGFNVFEHSMQEFVDFVENLIDPMDTKQEPKKEEAKKGSSKRKNKEANNGSKRQVDSSCSLFLQTAWS